MKFDLIIANPPFSNSGGRDHLWLQHYRKAIQLSKDKIYFFIPYRCDSDPHKIIEERLIDITPDISDQFPQVSIDGIHGVMTYAHPIRNWVSPPVQLPLHSERLYGYHMMIGLAHEEISGMKNLSYQKPDGKFILNAPDKKGLRYQTVRDETYDLLAATKKGRKMLSNKFLLLRQTTDPTGKVDIYEVGNLLVGQNVLIFGDNLSRLKEWLVAEPQRQHILKCQKILKRKNRRMNINILSTMLL